MDIIGLFILLFLFAVPLCIGTFITVETLKDGEIELGIMFSLLTALGFALFLSLLKGLL